MSMSVVLPYPKVPKIFTGIESYNIVREELEKIVLISLDHTFPFTTLESLGSTSSLVSLLVSFSTLLRSEIFRLGVRETKIEELPLARF